LSEFDADLLTQKYLQNPYSYYRELRENDPVHWSERLSAWLLTRYDDVAAAFRDPRLLSGTRIPTYVAKLPEADRKTAQALVDHIGTWVGFIDPPDHTRLRALVSKVFTPRTVERLRGQIQAITDELLEAVLPTGRMDIVADLAFPLPATVIGELLGLPREDQQRFKQWSNDITQFLGAGTPHIDVTRQARDSVNAIKDYLSVIFAERRRSPQDDLISGLLEVVEEGERLSEEELYGMCVFLLVAGHETTMSLIANGVLALLRNQEQARALRDDPTMAMTAVEELLRYDSPIQHQTRVAREDFHLAGKHVKAGQRVLPLLGSANRDPARFENPDRLVLNRKPNRHVAFGYGLHYCIGAPLARLEGQIAFNTLLRRLPSLSLMEDTITWREDTSMRSPVMLPVRFDGDGDARRG